MTWFRSLFGIFQHHGESSRPHVPVEPRPLQISELEQRLLLSGYHLDFGTSTSPVESGYVGAPVAGYSSSTGYGWVDSSSVLEVVRSSGTAITCDFHAGKDSRLQLDLPNGTYLVTPTLGDVSTVRDHMDLYLNGVQVASDITVLKGDTYRPTYLVNVTDGSLTLRLVDNGGETVRWALDALDVVNEGAPQVSLTGLPTSEVKEGSPITVGSQATDSPEDLAAGLIYAWSVTKNGNAYSQASGTAGSFTFTPDDEGTYVVAVNATDQNGATSSTASARITVVDSLLRANHLGPYKGNAGTAVNFVGVARDAGLIDSEYGFSYSWRFGDGTTGTGATVSHTYATAGTYNVALTVTGRNGLSATTRTTTTIAAPSTPPSSNDFRTVSANNLLSNTVYGKLQWKEMAASGAWGVNADWEAGTSSKWYIEQQRYGADLVMDGLLHKNTATIAAGLKAIDWGFQHQASDGSFAGTEDPFHSTSFFVEAVTRACYAILQSSYAGQYQAKVDSYKVMVHNAAQWMARPDVWSNGIKNDEPYSHRYYLVADAMGMTSRLVGGDATLMNLARSRIQDALAKQWDNGVNPEAGGYDSSYQAVGLSYAQLWVMYFPKESTTSAVKTMIDKGLAWELSRILSDGEVNTEGNTRTGVEIGPSGTIKTVDWRNVVDAFAWQFQTTGDLQWQAAGQKVAEYYFKTY